MRTKTQQSQVRLTPDEKQLLVKAAARRGMEISEYIRTLVMIDFYSKTTWDTFIGLMHNAMILFSKRHK